MLKTPKAQLLSAERPSKLPRTTSSSSASVMARLIRRSPAFPSRRMTASPSSRHLPTTPSSKTRRATIRSPSKSQPILLLEQLRRSRASLRIEPMPQSLSNSMATRSRRVQRAPIRSAQAPMLPSRMVNSPSRIRRLHPTSVSSILSATANSPLMA